MTALAFISQVVLLILGVFLMIVVLLQRGRGGGLAGAFGGMGGQSAFGTKAGDVFTRITIVIAIIWVILAGGSGYLLRAAAEQRGKGFGNPKSDAALTDRDAESAMGTPSGEGAAKTDTSNSEAGGTKGTDETSPGDDSAAPTTQKPPPDDDRSSRPDAADSTGKPERATPPASSEP